MFPEMGYQHCPVMVLVQNSEVGKLLVEKHSGILPIEREPTKQTNKQAAEQFHASNVRETFQ